MQERRRETDVQIGYLTGKLEEFGEILKSHLTEDAKHLENIATKLDKLEDKVSEKFTTVETTFRVFRWIGAALVALATLQWGDLAQLIEKLFK